MALQDTIDSGRASEGKTKFQQNNEKLKQRFQEIKERYAQKPHPAFGEVNGKEYHCAYDNYGIGCYSFTHTLPKGTPKQEFMDTLFHELENTPPVDEINDLIYEMETYVGAQALAAKEKIVSKLKEMSKQAANKVKTLVKGTQQAKTSNEESSWVEELFDLFMDVLSGDVSLSTIARLFCNILKLTLKLAWKQIQRTYEPYINTILLIIWWINVIIQFLTLVLQRIGKVIELLQRVANFQIRIPSDTAARCYMHGPAQAEPSLIIKNIVLDNDSQTALQQANAAKETISKQVENLQDLQDAIKSEIQSAKNQQELKNTEAALAKNISSAINTALSETMSALGVQDALQSLSEGIGNMSEAMQKLAKISAMAANVDKMIDKLCDAIFGVLDKILKTIGEAADSVGLGWMV